MAGTLGSARGEPGNWLPYRKGSSTKEISKAGDFILWYAKDKAAPMQFQTLYEEQSIEE